MIGADSWKCEIFHITRVNLSKTRTIFYHQMGLVFFFSYNNISCSTPVIKNLHNLIYKRNVAREHQIILNQPHDERLPHGNSKFIDDTQSRGHDEYEIVEKYDDEVTEPLDFSVVAE